MHKEFVLMKKISITILNVFLKGIKPVIKTSASSNFIIEIGKIGKLSRTDVSKRFTKGRFQLYFELVNKVLLPRSEKSIVNTISDMFLMESLSRLEDINLPSIMLEHIRKIITSKEGKHGLAYGYLLNGVFAFNQVKLGT